LGSRVIYPCPAGLCPAGLGAPPLTPWGRASPKPPVGLASRGYAPRWHGDITPKGVIYPFTGGEDPGDRPPGLGLNLSMDKFIPWKYLRRYFLASLDLSKLKLPVPG